ncbi:MAG: endolytic transglycosylase MltG [Sphingobacteriales bacterium]|nr:MAG: endolytic transglycosylase MltG [Sphingobacteriales bacterium]TAF80801.1 MAG: endolytic transglycosylase MltG [Sphingobacteriales bacterium]
MLKKQKKTLFLIFGLIFILIATFKSYKLYTTYFASNNKNIHKIYLYIPSNATYQQVLDSITARDFLKNSDTFIELANQRNLKTRFKPGKYPIKPNMNNRQILNMLLAGNQEAVNIAFQNIRLKESFVALVTRKIECDSVMLMRLLDSTSFISKYGFTKENSYTMFIPNSYQLFWNTSAEKFFDKMHQEYLRFWNKNRLLKAKYLNLSPQQVSILASIVDSEALMDNEMPTIAGLYLNRLQKGIKLEADPTVIFANNDFTIHRVLNRHLRTPSPYNTYLNFGLPPGPITMPSIKAIDAVLNHENHNYIYMCAKEDFSGYHNFASSVTQHLINAKKFQHALDQRNIKK